MKRRWVFPLVTLLLFSLSCNLTDNLSKSKSEPTVAPPTLQPATAAPTEKPPATAAPAEPEPTEVQPTETEAPPECPAYYTETFDEPNDCWDFSSPFSVSEVHNPDLVEFGLSAGYFDITASNKEEMFLYFLNEEWDYPTVVVEAEVVNHAGTNKNGIVLACYVNEKGWYEVRLETGGFFQVYQFNAALWEQGENPYTTLHQGGAKGIRIGYDRINTMTWICNDKDLTFLLNGQELWATTLREVNAGGGVGIGLTTYKDNWPVDIGFESLTVSEP